MASGYTISKHGVTGTNNGGSFNIVDETVNVTDTSLSLVGKYHIGYGADIAQNQVSLLENFASDTAPSNPIEGQLWWKPIDKQLFVRSNGTWLGIDSDSKVTSVLDTASVAHTVVVSKVNGVVTSITSSDTTDWVINISETTLEPFFRDNGLVGTSGAATIKAGINLNTDSTKAMKFHGTATTAQYADVAELYVSDKEYEPGHVMKIGGAEEVTETSEAADTDVLGIVTTDPALLMNSKLAGVTVGIALLGRVPCKVTGQITKGDRIVTSGTPGHGQSAHNVNEHSYQHVIGRALQSKTTPGEGVIEVIVGVK
tara:strand:+ start:1456 stop:2394 length:939 start_codon:yes stop_codon:yes gene_type:complete